MLDNDNKECEKLSFTLRHGIDKYDNHADIYSTLLWLEPVTFKASIN